MGLFRFAREPLRALTILLEQFPAFLRLSWVCMAASLVGIAVAERHLWLGSVTDLLARGVFAVAWLRLVGRGERPGGIAYFRLGRREILTALGWTVAELFVVFPAQALGASLAMASGIAFADLVMPLLALSHALLGSAYLLPTETALKTGGGKGWQWPERVMKGGLAIGLAAFLAWLPVNLLLEAAKLLPEMELGDGVTLGLIVQVVIRYLGVALTAGSMALVWNALAVDEE